VVWKKPARVPSLTREYYVLAKFVRENDYEPMRRFGGLIFRWGFYGYFLPGLASKISSRFATIDEFGKNEAVGRYPYMGVWRKQPPDVLSIDDSSPRGEASGFRKPDAVCVGWVQDAPAAQGTMYFSMFRARHYPPPNTGEKAERDYWGIGPLTLISGMGCGSSARTPHTRTSDTSEERKHLVVSSHTCTRLAISFRGTSPKRIRLRCLWKGEWVENLRGQDG
jgi:hypothetical protein